MMDAAETGGEDKEVDKGEAVKNEDEVDDGATNVKKKIPITEDVLMGQVTWITTPHFTSTLVVRSLEGMEVFHVCILCVQMITGSVKTRLMRRKHRIIVAFM